MRWSLSLLLLAAGCVDDRGPAAHLDVDAPPVTEGDWYRPTVDTRWQWQLSGAPINTTYDVEVVQGGVFHSMAISLWVELGEEAEAAEVRKRIARSPAVSAVKQTDRLGPVAAANDERLLLGAVRAAATPGGYWVWAAMDNLVRGGALNAIGLAEELLGVGPAS